MTDPLADNPVADKFKDLSGHLHRVAHAASALQSGLGGLGRVFDTALHIVSGFAEKYVKLFNPAAVIKFEIATQDLYASIGEALLPVLDKATAVVRTVADAIAGLGPTGKLAIAVLAGAAVGLGVTAAAASALAIAINSATLGIPALVAAVLGVGAGAAFAMTTMTDLREGLGGFRDVLGAVFEAAGAVLVKVGAAVQPAMSALAGSVGEAVKAVFGAMSGAGDVAGGMAAGLAGVVRVIGTVVEVVAKIVSPFIALGQVISSVVGPVLEGLSMGLRVLAIPFKVIGSVAAGLAAGLGRVAGVMSRAFESVMVAIRPAVDAIEKAADKIAEAVGGAVVAAFNAALPFLEVAADIFGKVIVRVANAVTFVCEVMEGLVQIAKDFGLIEDENAKPIGKKDRGSPSEGKSIRAVNFGSVEEVIRRSYTNAAMSGRGAKDFQSETAKNTAIAAGHLGTLVAQGNKPAVSQNSQPERTVYDRIGESRVGQALLDRF